MAYNVARELKLWKEAKRKEDDIMKQYGISEEIIHELYVFDLALFNSDRRFRDRQFTNCMIEEQVSIEGIEMPANNIFDILQQIEDQELYHVIVSLSDSTLEIIFLKMCGFSNKEIASIFGVTPGAISKKIRKIRKKLKKIALFNKNVAD